MSKINGNIIQNNLEQMFQIRHQKFWNKNFDFGSKINDATKVTDYKLDNQITKDYELGKETDLTKVVMQQQVANINN